MLARVDFLAAIERYLAQSNQAPTSFGIAATGDPNFVATLRSGREAKERTQERVQRYMHARPARPRVRRRALPKR